MSHGTKSVFKIPHPLTYHHGITAAQNNKKIFCKPLFFLKSGALGMELHLLPSSLFRDNYIQQYKHLNTCITINYHEKDCKKMG